MGMLHNIMDKLGRYRLIKDRLTNEDYMHRYYLFLKDRKTFPFNITLHKIVKSDEPVYHDHPWNYTTIILKGGYWEHTPSYNKYSGKTYDKKTWRGPGSIINRKAEEFHWLEVDSNIGPVTTLFIMGKQTREWGFMTNKTWVKFKEYLKN